MLYRVWRQVILTQRGITPPDSGEQWRGDHIPRLIPAWQNHASEWGTVAYILQRSEDGGQTWQNDLWPYQYPVA